MSKLEEIIKKMHETILIEDGYLENENEEIPSIEIIQKTTELLTQLSVLDIYPERVNTSIDGGMCLIFEKLPLRLFLELYNNNEIGYIIEEINLKRLIENEEIKTLEETKNKIVNFLQ